MQLTAILLEKCVGCPPALAEIYAPCLTDATEHFGITTPLRVAHFLAQVGHESNSFRSISENLNYSALRLMKIWPRRFPTVEIALKYERNPEAIANIVYANRMGNGSPLSGDGWRYRGRGLIQLTGKDNYKKLQDFFDEDFVGNPDLLLQPYWASMSAAWFWRYGAGINLNVYADRDDIVEITKKINGGTHGLEDRRQRLERAKNALGI